MRRLFSSMTGVATLRIVVALIFVLPLLWTLSAALRPLGTPLPRALELSPPTWTAANFGLAWRMVPMLRYLLNSSVVALLAVPLTLVTSSWAGFAMARLPIASQRRWVAISLAILMVPSIALWPPRFLVFRQLGWLDSYVALIAPAMMGTSPFFVLMFYRAFRRIPKARYDAARVEGAGIWRSWSSIALPGAFPTVVGVAILALAFYWGDFLSPMLYLRSESLYTLPVALRFFQQLTPSDWSLLMAAVLSVAAVPIIIFLLAQPYYVHLQDRS